VSSRSIVDNKMLVFPAGTLTALDTTTAPSSSAVLDKTLDLFNQPVLEAKSSQTEDANAHMVRDFKVVYALLCHWDQPVFHSNSPRMVNASVHQA
jgi:hypothetical protein